MEFAIISVVGVMLLCKFWKTCIPLGVLFLGIMSDGVLIGICGAAVLWLIFNIEEKK